jgi:dihydroorotate dehydrogenase (fumarate)
MDLSTTYLGLELPHPFMPGASPLVDDLDTVRRLEDAGAAAIVMHSLFEEQIVNRQEATAVFADTPAESFAEALTYLPEPTEYRLGPEEYLEQIARLKQAVDLPVIASLNGTTRGAWLEYASLIEAAGADALELNTYQLATDLDIPAQVLEHRIIDITKYLKAELRIPVALKLSPYYTAMAHFAHQLDQAGADGLVLFNRFYQAEINVEELEVERTLTLSSPAELLLRLRWLAVLSGRIRPDLAVTGGVHDAVGAIKAVMCGAHAVQLVACLLQHGPERLGFIRDGVEEWLVEHEYESLRQMQGSMSLERCPDPSAYERGNYVGVLQSWRSEPDRFGIN